MKRLSAVLCAVSFVTFAGAPTPQPTSAPKDQPKSATVVRGTGSGTLGTVGSVGTGGLGTGTLGTRGSGTTKTPKPTSK
ncbi:MAG: hypothetical protein JNJ54_24280 [Myxococcaceae bacterium]|nr:hypothetical protein [Myxococcaceae bacterium]